METYQESPLPSPHASSTTTTSNPPTPKSLPRSDANPYPTTFIQADSATFKHVVQMLTGSAETAAKNAAGVQSKNSSSTPLTARPPGPKKPAFKLYERRGSFRHLKMINPLLPAFLSSNPGSGKHPEILSPSMLDMPSLVLSPVTPLIADPFNRCSPRPPSSASSSSTLSDEDRAIAEKGFYLHPSPRAVTPTDPPRLLPLFPLTSPRTAAAGENGV